MHPILQNRFFRFAGIGILIIFVLLILWGAMNLATSSTGLSDESFNMAPSTISNSNQAERGMAYEEGVSSDSAYYPPQPISSGYTADLETYETTTYALTARTKQFDDVCSFIRNLKTDTKIHFKTLNESTNNCNANFFVEEAYAESVLAQLTAYEDAEYTRNTQSVTKHRQNLQSQTSILQRQLNNVQKSLTTAERQLDNLNNTYFNSEDVATLSLRVNESLRFIEQLNQKKINLTNQLSYIYQQAADLEERLNVVEFSTNISRSNPAVSNLQEPNWDRAWNEVKNVFNDTLMGLSTTFLILLLWITRMVIYLIVIALVLRGLYKFGKFVLNKW